MQFGSYNKFDEQRYRQQFEKQFDFLSFNKEITMSHGSGNFTIAFAPIYISKPGRKLKGLTNLGWVVAGQAKFGLEISGIVSVDIDNKIAFHLEAVQTPTYADVEGENMSLLDWYANIIVQRKDTFATISNDLVANAYFSKKPFADKIIKDAQIYLISCLRNNADDSIFTTANQRAKRAGQESTMVK